MLAFEVDLKHENNQGERRDGAPVVAKEKIWKVMG